MRFLKSIFAPAPLRRLAAVIALGVMPGLAAAQSCPDYTVSALQNLSFTGEQLATPQTLQMVAGGDVQLSNCPSIPGYGYVVTGPDFDLQLSGVAPGSSLAVRVSGQCDTMILANDYTGAWHFNDDTSGLDPEVILPAADGVYDIWVGTYEAATCNATFTLQLVQGGAPTPTPTPTSAGATCPDATLPARAPLNFSAQQLGMQQRVDLVAGGNVDLFYCNLFQGSGYVVAEPDFEMNLTGTAPGATLTIGAEAQCDTVLLVNDNAGGWQFSDDASGLNPAVTLAAADGIYDIWVGTYGTELCEAQLTVQVAGSAAPQPDTGKPGTDGTTPTAPPAPVPAPAPAPAPSAEPDPGNLAGYRAQVGQTFTFTVTGSATGSVWGSGIYTDDSSLAAAAVHAGVLQPGQSGTVTVQVLGPQASFTGSPANGITSSNYGSWGGSYTFVQ